MPKKIKIKIQFTLPFITLFLVTIFFSSSALSFDGKPSIRFNHLTNEDGLPQNSVQSTLQDSTGFLWIGTEEGLVRYDGYSLKVFKHEPSNSYSLSDNYIFSLIEDSQGNLWVGSRGGLNHFNPKTQQFTQYRHQAGDANSLSDDSVRSILKNSQGNLWVGTRGGLNHFNPKTQQFTHYRHQANDLNSLSHDDVYSLLEDSQGNIWVGTVGGLNHFNPKTQQFTHYRHQPGDANGLSHDTVFSLLEDSQGNLWVGTRGGLNHFNPKTQQFTHYRHQPGDANSLSHDTVKSLLEDSQGNLWVGTVGGLNHFNPKTQQFTHYRHQAGDANSLSNDYVFSLLEDSQGNLWVGTGGGGLNHFNPKIQQFTQYRHQAGDANSLSDDYVRSILENSQGNLWVGTRGGLNHFNPKTQQFTHYRHQAGDANSLSDDYVRSLLENSQGNLWVGTWGGGLNHFNPKTQQFTQYRHQPGDANSLSHDYVSSLLEDSQGNLWVGTYGGLNHFNPKTQQFTHYRHQPGDANSLSHDYVSSLLEDSQGNLWVGTYSGLNHFNPKTQQFTQYRHQAGDPNSLSHDDVFSLLEDSQGNLWVGTRGGLNLFNNKTATFKRFTIINGLPNNVIYAIEEDKQGNIWLSTNQGLSRMTPKAETFRNYDVGDGLQSNEFNRRASFKSKSGELFFGGINGFNRFTPESIIDDKQVPIVLITDMFLLNESVPIVPLISSHSPILEQNTETNSLTVSSSSNAVDEVAGFSLNQVIHQTKAITLTYKDNIVAFEFSALHFSNPTKNKFAYQLVGWDKDWVSTDYKNRRATYTNLPNGDYTFRVKASNADGYWNEDGASLNITVLPPPWKTWWAYTLYGLFLLSLTFAFIQSQRKKVIVERAINEQLEYKVAERTAELEKVSLTDQLTGAHNRRFFHKHIGKEIAQIKRAYFKPKEGTPPKIGFIMLDMDHFKQVNDVHGHDAGDKVLVQLVKIITDTSRESDQVVRWGGEEFVVIANAVSLQEIQNLAERIRINIEAHSFDIGNGKTLNKTCSIGISSYPFIEKKPEALSWEQTLNIADTALYAVKNNGRNAWISLFEKDITNVDQLIEVTNSIESLIKNAHLSYETSLQKEVDWS
ncbi:ligand-binding sensor domain-containing diguanylate cyclase [Colwellia piezophila]|uniref:ligand-binding sensor domain-containing diguanylate cyclase n=1 Tax=Colwellia piezophila TaxID=211668 RepID=UPI00036D8250|nr:ligand-binding sensor domain-containing diguanylate cyclase [Colwellia piezophila]